MKVPHFNFGKNWDKYSEEHIDAERLASAKESLRVLLGDNAVTGKRFLDVGCGSGLFSIAAAECGAAQVTGIDVNERCIAVSERNWQCLGSPDAGTPPDFKQGSALDTDFMRSLGTYDYVYAWGSLHHTGDMWHAIKNTAQCVERPGGTFLLAIYNRHWSCSGWTLVKRIYNMSPSFIQGLMNYAFGAIIYLAKFAVTRQNPLTKERGMDFWYDIIDWLGGYPYEYASVDEMKAPMATMGFMLENAVPPSAPTGCNELVFRAHEPPAA